MGITLLLVCQAMVNMAVAVNLVPVTGQTLPFVSMGGSSILFSCFALGIVLNVSRGNKEPSLSDNNIVTDDKNDAKSGNTDQS